MGELYNLCPKLPKNIRQIGERDQVIRLYVEDYVNTYLRRLYPTGSENLRCGLLLGCLEENEGAPYIFIDGALEMECISEGGQLELTDQAWKKAYQEMEELFPKRDVQGWFLCGAPGSQLSPLNYWKQHGKYFPGKNKIMYLNSGMEGEEALYTASEDGFYRLKGYSIYYERNQMMQDYMISRKDIKRVDAGADDTVIRDFRRKMEERKEEIRDRKSTVHTLGGICGALSVAVLAGGIVMFNNYHKMKEMESVLVSVLPEGSRLLEEWEPGRLLPSAGPEKETETFGLEIEKEEFPEETEIFTETEEIGRAENEVENGPAEKEQTETQESEQEEAETSELPAADIPSLEEADERITALGESLEAAGTYVVQEGETLYGICLKKYQNLSRVEEICELNGLDDVNKIKAGQKLILP